MYEKLLDSKLKVAALVLLVGFAGLIIVNINRTDGRGKDRPAAVLPENAAGAAPSSAAGPQADAIWRDSQDTSVGSVNKPVNPDSYIYEKFDSPEEEQLNRSIVMEAKPEQILTEANMPPRIKKIRDRWLKKLDLHIKPGVTVGTVPTEGELKTYLRTNKKNKSNKDEED